MRNQTDSEKGHWQKMVDGGLADFSIPLWRDYCDGLHLRLMHKWLGGRRFEATLKTDLFDEAVGVGLVNWLCSVSTSVEGIDLMPEIAKRAADRNPEIKIRQADVRSLDAYSSPCFDLIVSNSTLDHFEDETNLIGSLNELARVLLPGGLMFVTLDNPQNPIVWIRNRRTSTWPGQSSLVPYFMGRTVPRLELIRMVEDAGLKVEKSTFIMHLPRVLFLHASRLFAAGSPSGKSMRGLMNSFELLNKLPSRSRTGHYSAVLASKPVA
ncbi:MAG: methyltransferase domain-containing protein [Planctomycetes bacterium]|nr:methyltransferase domain-containing protein [Planctomycetota bacterium]